MKPTVFIIVFSPLSGRRLYHIVEAQTKQPSVRNGHLAEKDEIFIVVKLSCDC